MKDIKDRFVYRQALELGRWNEHGASVNVAAAAADACEWLRLIAPRSDEDVRRHALCMVLLCRQARDAS